MPDDRNVAATASPSLSGSDDGGSNPESRQTQNLKRKRPKMTACELCKARKVKCDRAEPTCGWCARHNRECVYRERQKPGFRAAYGRELEQKINRLETMLHLLGRRVDEHLREHEAIKISETPRSRLIPPRNSSRELDIRSLNTPGSVGTSEVRNATPLDVRPPDDVRYQGAPFSRTSDAMSVQSMVNLPPPDSMIRQESSTGFGSRASYTQSCPPTDSDLPPPDLLYTIVDLYFKHVNTWCPILDRKVTFDTLLHSTITDESDRLLLHAIVATTLRFSKDPRLTPDSRKRYHDVAKQRILLHALEYPGVKALKALVILSLDLLGTSSGPPGWNILALIVRNVVQLGLTVEKRVILDVPPYPSSGSLQQFLLPQPTSWIEDEGRRRLFWMTYILDRYACVAAGTDFTLDESETDRPLPCSFDLFSKNNAVETRWFRGNLQAEVTVNRPENLGSFSYHCEVLRILSRIHTFLRKPLDIGSLSDVEKWQNTYRDLDNELNKWLYNLPDDYSRISQLCHSDPTSKISNWIMLHAAFVISVIRLHSCAAYPTVRSHIFTPSYNAMQRCLAAVESLREIAQDVVNTGMLDLLGPHFAFSLWVSARLLLVHASATGTDVDRSIGFFVSTLGQMGQHWEIARSYTKILDRVLQEYQESKRSTPGPNGASSSLAPKSLAAMRRCAYNLSLLMSQRASSVLKPPSVKTFAPNELEYFDVFDFFNYPRLPPAIVHGATAAEPTVNLENLTPAREYFVTTNFSVPPEASDWPTFRPPQD
ncbi:hypothetical protein VTO42DRAFT_8255 [Malbranchea cinnamomea]